jgi:hypothetical protein
MPLEVDGVAAAHGQHVEIAHAPTDRTQNSIVGGFTVVFPLAQNHATDFFGYRS